MKYVKRDEANIFITEDDVIDYVILDNYPYMYNDFVKTHPNSSDTYEYLYEIVDQKRVVGAIFFNLYEDYGLIKSHYIIPKYRKKFIFGRSYKDLTLKLAKQVNYIKPIIIDDATNEEVGNLVENELATQFRWGIVITNVPLKLYLDENKESYITTFIYDSELESAIYLDTDEENSKISLPSDYTKNTNIEKYEELLKKRENKVQKTYFKTVNQILKENKIDYEHSLMNKQEIKL